MRAISLIQPFASMVASGRQRFIHAGWSDDYRGPVAIHAAGFWPESYKNLCGQEPYKSALHVKRVPRRVILAVADLVDCIHVGYPLEIASELQQQIETDCGAVALKSIGYVLQFDNVRRVKGVIRCKGYMGRLWFLEWRALEALERQFPEVKGR